MRCEPELERLWEEVDSGLDQDDVDTVLSASARARKTLSDLNCPYSSWAYWAGVLQWAESYRPHSPSAGRLKEESQEFVQEWRRHFKEPR
jgi:hypothetical protein